MVRKNEIELVEVNNLMRMFLFAVERHSWMHPVESWEVPSCRLCPFRLCVRSQPHS